MVTPLDFGGCFTIGAGASDLYDRSRSPQRSVDQNDVRTPLDALETDFTAVTRHVEVPNTEAAAEIRQLAFVSRLEVDQPEILMFNLPSERDERPPFRHEGEPSGTAGQHQ